MVHPRLTEVRPEPVTDSASEPVFVLYDGMTQPGMLIKIGEAKNPEDLDAALAASEAAKAANPNANPHHVSPEVAAWMISLATSPRLVEAVIGIRNERQEAAYQALRERLARGQGLVRPEGKTRRGALSTITNLSTKRSLRRGRNSN